VFLEIGKMQKNLEIWGKTPIFCQKMLLKHRNLWLLMISQYHQKTALPSGQFIKLINDVLGQIRAV
jgi:hypothetical protein